MYFCADHPAGRGEPPRQGARIDDYIRQGIDPLYFVIKVLWSTDIENPKAKSYVFISGPGCTVTCEGSDMAISGVLEQLEASISSRDKTKIAFCLRHISHVGTGCPLPYFGLKNNQASRSSLHTPSFIHLQAISPLHCLPAIFIHLLSHVDIYRDEQQD